MSIQIRRRHNLKKLDQSVRSFISTIHRCNHYSFGEFLDKISAGSAMNYIDSLGIKEHDSDDMKTFFTLIRAVYYEEIRNKYNEVCGM